MKFWAADVLSKLSTPMTVTCESGPPAASCECTVAARGGSSSWQASHQAPKNRSTVGAPDLPAGSPTVGEPTPLMFSALKEGAGPPWCGAADVPPLSPDVLWAPRLVKMPTRRTTASPIPVPMSKKRLRGVRAIRPGLSAPGEGSGSPGGVGTSVDIARSEPSEADCG